MGRAAAYAREVHADDVRKGTGRSYFDAHLVEVAALVALAGGDEVQIAAAFLHDTAEDHGGARRLDHLRETFGDHPACDELVEIVEHLSDSLADTTAGEAKAPWRERKQAYLDSLVDKPARSLEVAAADKFHNANSILLDLRSIGPEIWQRFTVTDPALHLWYYGALADLLADSLPGSPTVDALVATVERLRSMVD